eukprot:scaffold74681_cov40-Prasinocladus_malaysianus.AAC.1
MHRRIECDSFVMLSPVNRFWATLCNCNSSPLFCAYIEAYRLAGRRGVYIGRFPMTRESAGPKHGPWTCPTPTARYTS